MTWAFQGLAVHPYLCTSLSTIWGLLCKAWIQGLWRTIHRLSRSVLCKSAKLDDQDILLPFLFSSCYTHQKYIWGLYGCWNFKPPEEYKRKTCFCMVEEYIKQARPTFSVRRITSTSTLLKENYILDYLFTGVVERVYLLAISTTFSTWFFATIA